MNVTSGLMNTCFRFGQTYIDAGGTKEGLEALIANPNKVRILVALGEASVVARPPPTKEECLEVGVEVGQDGSPTHHPV